MRVQKLNRRQARQTLYLSRFNFILKYIPGSKMGKADSLSRRLDWKVGIKKDNEDKTLVKPEQLEVRKIEKVEVIIEEVDLLEKVRWLKVKNNEVVKAVEEIKWARVKVLRDEEQREVDGIIYKERKMYMPKDNIFRAEIIKLYYNMPVEGHGRQWKTVELVTRNFWWLEVTKKVKRHIEGCNSCQKNKNCTKQLVGKLISNSILEKSWTYISADFITKLSLAQSYNSILVVITWPND